MALLVHASSSNATKFVPTPLDSRALKPLSSLLPVGSVAPDFVLKDIRGTRYSLVAQRGHPLLLEFFAVWSPACRMEARVINRLARQDIPRGVRVWSILANPYVSDPSRRTQDRAPLVVPNDLVRFSKTFHRHYPQLIDPRFTVVNEYAIRSYPVLYVVSRHGLITFAAVGLQPYHVLASHLQAALRAA